MAVLMDKLVMSALPELRTEPVDKWVRASVNGRTLVDSRRPRLVWEPRRVVPSYAVPVGDVAATVVPFEDDVVVSAGDQVLADSRRATALFESPLLVRYYLPAEDVRMDALEPSGSRSVCAYKGRASYWSVVGGGPALADVAWTYREPLADAVPVKDLVAFFTERLDLTLDGERVPRPVTPWS
jgi:uncharacterized protein (DUF427 family)